MSGFLIGIRTNHRGAYLAGIIIFMIISVGLIVGGFASAYAGGGEPKSYGIGLGITGCVLLVGDIVLLIEYLTTGS